MRSGLTILGASALLALTACKKSEGDTASSGAGGAGLTAAQPKEKLNDLRLPSTGVVESKSFARSIEAMRVVSLSQQELYKRTGGWVTQESASRYEVVILEAVSQDILGRSYVSQGDRGRSLMSDLNGAGYHLYLSQTLVEGEPYLGATLFTLGALKSLPELLEVKRVMGMTENPAKLRQLKEVCATEYSDSLYGSVGADGHIFIDPWLLMKDQTASERDLKTLFKSVFANELAHLKLQESRINGILSAKEHALDEAFSDYWTLAVTPPREVLFAAMDVMGSAPLRYGESKLCALEGFQTFGTKCVSGFNGAMDERSVTLVVDYANDAGNITALPRLKQELLHAYRKRLIERGFPESLFLVHE